MKIVSGSLNWGILHQLGNFTPVKIKVLSKDSFAPFLRFSLVPILKSNSLDANLLYLPGTLLFQIDF